MTAYPIPKRPKLTAKIAIAVGLIVALWCMLAPTALLPAAGPLALGALAMVAGGVAAAIAWLVGLLLPGRAAADAVSRGDAHSDALTRAPLLATRDLGTLALDIPPLQLPAVDRKLPRDLDAPLSAFDPQAIPAVAAEPVRAVASLRDLESLRAVPNPANRDQGERFETFELPRPAPSPSFDPPIVTPRTDATIHALLDRLERGVAAGASARKQPDSVDETLNLLRRMATG